MKDVRDKVVWVEGGIVTVTKLRVCEKRCVTKLHVTKLCVKDCVTKLRVTKLCVKDGVTSCV